MSESVLTISRIPKSTNNPKDKTKSIENYPIKEFKGLTISEKGCFHGILNLDISTSSILVTFSDSIIFEILQEII